MQLGPGKVGVDPAAEAAIRAGNDVLTTHQSARSWYGKSTRDYRKTE
jgi:hypothetical protein